MVTPGGVFINHMPKYTLNRPNQTNNYPKGNKRKRKAPLVSFIITNYASGVKASFPVCKKHNRYSTATTVTKQPQKS